MVTHVEPDILECEVKWALGGIAANKGRRGDGIPAELFKLLKDDAVKVLCQGPASAGSGGHPQDERRRRERERKTRETSLDKAKSARERGRERERPDRGCRVWQSLAMLYFFPGLLYPKLVHFLGEDSLTLRQLVLHKTGVFSAYFFVYEGLVHYLLALGPINISCRSGECKPIFRFYGDLN